MKRRSIISIMCMAAAMTLATSCNDSYPGLEYTPDNTDVPTNTEGNRFDKVPIKVYTKDPGYFSLLTRTRGTGAYENSQNRNIVVNVFAFRVGTDKFALGDALGGQAAINSTVDLQYTAYSTQGGTKDADNEHCLVDGPDYNLGMPFVFMAPDSESGTVGVLQPKDKNTSLYYSGTYQDVGYNFFGYCIDDFKPTAENTHRTASSISYDIVLDGYRDIMLGYADSLKAAHFEPSGIYGEAGVAKADKETILKMYGGYSTYAGHRNVNPIINLKHQLARLSFQAYPGDASANDVTIMDIKVEAPARATMVVAGRRYKDGNMKFSSERNYFHLSEAPSKVGDPYSGKLKDGGYTVRWNSSLDKDGNMDRVVNIGSSLLLAPSNIYTVYITYKYHKKVNSLPGQPAQYEDEVRTAKYNIKAPEGDVNTQDEDGNPVFKAGILYTIKIAVFGLQKITIGGGVEGWKEYDHSINIDPDSEDFS